MVLTPVRKMGKTEVVQEVRSPEQVLVHGAGDDRLDENGIKREVTYFFPEPPVRPL
jgi:hypothetical protein